MGSFMMVSGRMINNMDLELNSGQIMLNMKEIMSKEIKVEKEIYYLLMDLIMRVSSIIIALKAKELMCGKMANSMKVSEK